MQLISDIERLEDEDTGNKYIDTAGKAEEICHLITSLVESQANEKLSAEERALASRAVRAEYLSRNITEDPESIYQSGGKTTGDGTVFIEKPIKKCLQFLALLRA